MKSVFCRPLVAAVIFSSFALCVAVPVALPISSTRADGVSPVRAAADKKDDPGFDFGPDIKFDPKRLAGDGDKSAPTTKPPKTQEPAEPPAKKSDPTDMPAPKADPTDMPSEAPAPGADEPKPDTERKPLAEDVQRKKAEELLTFLEGQYEKKMDSQDWVSRALATLSIARSPRPTATKRMFEVMERDKHPVVKLIAWQAVLARAKDLSAAEHQRWIKATLPMAEKGYFNGGLRIPLLQVMATAPVTAQGKHIFGAIFDSCDAWEPADIPTLDALGVCLGTWKDKSIAESLIKRLTDQDAGVRAEYVLRGAGATAKPARELVGDVWDPLGAKRPPHPSSATLWPMVQASYADWLKKSKADWKSDAPADEGWKNLSPKYIEPPTPMESVDYRDPIWKQDLELGRVNLTDFEVVFCVDATGSMGSVIEWLKRDVFKMMAALSNISSHPHLGLTFYRDTNLGAASFVTKVIPLTGDVKQLVKGLGPITADGGGDIPEAVADGLDAAVKQSKWTTRGKVGVRTVVLIGDAPPHEKDVKKCLDNIKSWAGDGYRFYTVKVTSDLANNDLTTFDQIAAAGRGQAVPANFPPLATYQFLDPTGKPIDIKTIERPEAQLIVAKALPAEHPGEMILTQILSSAMNPQFKNRVAPLIATLLAYSDQSGIVEKRKAFPANTPPINKGTVKTQ